MTSNGRRAVGVSGKASPGWLHDHEVRQQAPARCAVSGPGDQPGLQVLEFLSGQQAAVQQPSQP